MMSTKTGLAAPSSAAAHPDAAALAALDRLADVLVRENAALRARDHRALAALTEEKRAAVAACEGLLEAAPAVDGGAGAAAAPARALVRVKARLADLMAENQRRLRIAIAANRRLIETIAVAAQTHGSSAGGYAGDGRSEAAVGRKAAVPAMSFSRAL
jgi:hypothetical protein